jgi:hypothetical protein
MPTVIAIAITATTPTTLAGAPTRIAAIQPRVVRSRANRVVRARHRPDAALTYSPRRRGARRSRGGGASIGGGP